MKKCLLLLLLMFIGCDEWISKAEKVVDEKTNLEIARENIIGNWYTQNPPHIHWQGTSWTDSLYLTFDQTNFDFSVYPIWKSKQKSYNITGEYTLDSDSTIIIEIKNINNLSGIEDYSWNYNWRINKTYFWDIRILTELRLELCFEPIDNTNRLYNYYYYFTHP
ncbi:hypothetical protein MUP95_09370 [bacterium]|nr:hypothetical protein [bacterium]